MPLGPFRIRIAWILWVLWTLWDHRPGIARRNRQALREAVLQQKMKEDLQWRREQDLREIECQQFVEEFDAWWLTQGVK